MFADKVVALVHSEEACVGVFDHGLHVLELLLLLLAPEARVRRLVFYVLGRVRLEVTGVCVSKGSQYGLDVLVEVNFIDFDLVEACHQELFLQAELLHS